MRNRIVMAFCAASFACTTSDYGTLEAASLTVSPCEDHQPRTFAPFHFEANLMRWFAAEGVATIEMRTGYRAVTISDIAVLQFADTDDVRRRFLQDPATRFSVDGDAIRLSVVLSQTCPDATQPLVAVSGSLTFREFEPWKGGHIAGEGTVVLADARSDRSAVLLAKDVRLAFSMKVRSGPPYEDFTNWR